MPFAWTRKAYFTIVRGDLENLEKLIDRMERGRESDGPYLLMELDEKFAALRESVTRAVNFR